MNDFWGWVYKRIVHDLIIEVILMCIIFGMGPINGLGHQNIGEISNMCEI